LCQYDVVYFYGNFWVVNTKVPVDVPVFDYTFVLPTSSARATMIRDAMMTTRMAGIDSYFPVTVP
jgi:hypothetical protein